MVSKTVAEKTAASGLKLCHLMKSYERASRDGRKCLFVEKVRGKVRVTDS